MDPSVFNFPVPGKHSKHARILTIPQSLLDHWGNGRVQTLEFLHSPTPRNNHGDVGINYPISCCLCCSLIHPCGGLEGRPKCLSRVLGSLRAPKMVSEV